ncbi:MAG: hypothetical protein RL632_1483, partial [Bacteroidota bacterium]
FLLSECSKMNLNPCFIADIDNQKWTFNLSNGGYPNPVPVVDELKKGIHFNPLMEDEEFDYLRGQHQNTISKIPLDNKELYLFVEGQERMEIWKCSKHFSIKDATVYILNQREDKKESWISFSTGKVVRPDVISEGLN